MNPLKTLLLACTAALAASAMPASAGQKGAYAPNGQPTRPFYIYGHNPNKVSEMQQALRNGANALEPDLYRFGPLDIDIGTGQPINRRAGPSGLFVAHDTSALATPQDLVTLEAYLAAVREEVQRGANVASIALDIKTSAVDHIKAHPLRMRLVQRAVNDHLNHGGVRAPIVYSVGSLDDAGSGDTSGVFATLCLANHEGIMIDGETTPRAVYNNLFGQIQAARGVCPGGVVPLNIGFGAGSIGESLPLPISPGVPEIRTAVQEASWLRTALPIDMAVVYAYPITTARFGRYFTAGVDGMIPDVDQPIPAFAVTLQKIQELATAVQASADHYLATAADNPFTPQKRGYGVRVVTATNPNAFADYGTNDAITFRLTGSCSSAIVTVAGDDFKQFKSGDTNYVTIPSRNLGRLRSISLSSSGNDAWTPVELRISSDRWGIPEAIGAGFLNSLAVDQGVSRTFSFTAANAPGIDFSCDTDQLPMSAAPSQIPAPTLSGFTTNTSVLMRWNWQDPSGSGLDARYCTTQGQHTLAQGRHTLSARCESKAGNIGTATHVITVDTLAPNIVLSSPLAQRTYRVGEQLSFAFTASDEVSGVASLRALLNGSSRVAVLPIANGLTVPASALRLGTNTLELTATDRAGLVRKHSVSFTVVAN